MSSRPAVLVLAALALALGGAATAACGTDPVGVDSCRKIESARCENAPSCGIDLTQPAHRGDSPNLDVGACKRFYDDQCLHGLVVSEDPGAVKVQACVDTLNDPATSCDVIVSPERSPSCAFLSPAADASAD
ncbi:MAG: hypothetical protein JWP97_4812 [Labilithrix sp.]|nr:hypothetical protein [Labilithrix sp.]